MLKRRLCRSTSKRSATESHTKKLQKNKLEKREITESLGALRRKYNKKSPPGSSVREESTNAVSTTKTSDGNCLLTEPTSRWLIVELTEDTSLESHYEHIERTIRDTLGSECEYFIPVYNEKVQGKNACCVLFEGYLFIKRTDAVMENVLKLKSEHIKGPLFVDGCLRLVSGERVNKFKLEMTHKVKDMIPEKGQHVIPRIGVFRNLEGVVLSVNKRTLVALVRFEKTTRIVDAPINIVNLSVVTGNEQPDSVQQQEP
jgi:hypothetical protein